MDIDIDIRRATSGDAKAIAELIRKLGRYERLEHIANPDPQKLAKHLALHGTPIIYCFIASIDGADVGYVLGYPVYSTFRTSFDVHVEDLYVDDVAQDQGIGRRLLGTMCQHALECGYTHLKLEVINWNEGAIRFYKRHGGDPDDQWSDMHFDEAAMRVLAATI